MTDTTRGLTTRTETTETAFRFLGITDECVTCERCGRDELKSTVVLATLDADSNPEGVAYFGSSCAARALGVRGDGRNVLQSARWAHTETVVAAAEARQMLAHYGLSEAGEPDRDTIRTAMRRYVQAHPCIGEHVQETGVGVRERVLDMLARKRSAIAAHDLLTAAGAR